MSVRRGARAGVWGQLLLAGVLAGCADLPAVDLGTCGNHVVEAGEDCDGFPAGACRAPGSERACRFDCSVDANGARRACPTGLACGADSVCRAPTGELGSASTASSTPTIRTTLADFDGDGRRDLLAVTPAAVEVHYFDSAGVAVRTIEYPATPSAPATGDLTGDGRADAAIVGELSMAVLRGAADGTLQPTAYSPFQTPSPSTRMVALDAMPRVASPLLGLDYSGDEVLFLDGHMLLSVMDTAVLSESLPGDAADLIGNPLVAQLYEDPTVSPCQELVLAYAEDTRVFPITPCRPAVVSPLGGAFDWNVGPGGNPIVNLGAVSLPPGHKVVGRVSAIDLDRDGHLDLVVQAEGPLGTGMYAAYGLGDGTFKSDPDPSVTVADGAFGAEPVVRDVQPIALGRINEDAPVDIVLPNSILVSSTDDYLLGAVNFERSWTEAIIADVNGNGLTDVVALDENAAVLDFYNNAGGGVLNHTPVTLRAPGHALALADLDGDLVQDVVLAERGVHGDDPAQALGDSLSVLFGRGFGAPEPPITLGRLAKIRQILVGHLASAVGVVDGLGDLGVTSNTEDEAAGTVAVFSGSSDRQVSSPFQFQSPDDVGQQLRPVRTLIGQFDGDAANHLDIAVLVANDYTDVAVPGAKPSALAPGQFAVALLPSTGEAELSAATVRYSDPLPQEFEWGNAIFTRYDLGDDGLDDVIALGPYYTSGGAYGGALIVMRTQRDGAGDVSTSLAGVEATEELYSYDDTGAVFGGVDALPGFQGTTSGKVEVRDMDADGDPDVVALSSTIDVNTYETVVRIVIFPNAGDGTFPAADRVVLTTPAGVDLASFALIELDGDAAPEIALVGGSGVWLADLDVGAHDYAGLRPVVGAYGGRYASAGDVTGDGVDDLLVAGFDGARLYPGMPVLR